MSYIQESLNQAMARDYWLNMKTAEAIQRFVAAHFGISDRSEKTRKAYECDLGQFLEFCFHNSAERLDRISPDLCERWIEELQSLQRAPTTLKRKAATLRCFFSYCVRRKWLTASPMSQLRLRLGSGSKIPNALNLTDARALLAQVRSERLSLEDQAYCGRIARSFLALRNQAVVEVLIATGLRVSELTGLDLSSIDLAERTIHVTGKGNRQRVAFLVDDTCFFALKNYLTARENLQLSTPAVFVNSRGARLSEQGVAYVLKCLTRSANISSHVTPHVLRHTAATLLLQNGVDIRLVQEFLGHRSITTTQRYAQVTCEHLRATLTERHHGQLINSASEQQSVPATNY